MNQKMHNARMLIDIRNRRIRIPLSTLALLHNPQCILLLVNPESRTIAVMPSADVKRSHRIHWEQLKKAYELTSINFIRSILQVCPEWLDKFTYKITGDYILSENIVEFCLDAAKPIINARSENALQNHPDDK